MRKGITKRSVDALQAGKRPVFPWDTDITGFGCKVMPSIRKVFLFQYSTRGQDPKTAPKGTALGKYGELTPDRALALAADLRHQVRVGADPAASRNIPSDLYVAPSWRFDRRPVTNQTAHE